MCVLGSEEIKKRIEKGLIRNFIDLRVQLQPNGFDCTLKSVAKLKSSGKIDFDNTERFLAEIEEIKFKEWVYLPQGIYKAILNEIVKLDEDLMAIAKPRSSLVRCGVDVITAVWDAGYEGRSEVAIAVHNPLGIWLKRNARIVQLVFIKLCSKTKEYSGVYKYENL
ncbi:MAG: deoxyuridine 5'-triphosphate nucleotidohydrolase [Archaeoglobaceae archaeon]|nr:deoxyuridine 5'-triphosphate nucleotidohydrolase [Archaeoglobaceae archaeon]MDW8118006.1 deoxyuridine 5'-triphosphate nucleotidohydrolase [Archaeoglobaceae archaeon]